MKLLDTIATIPVYQDAERIITFIAGAMIDGDGDPTNKDKDPHWQPTTSLTYRGQPIDAQKVPYIVVPPSVRDKARGIVMGSLAIVTNLNNGKSTFAVVADEGPEGKLGEMSCEAARRIGIRDSAKNGGTKLKIVKYKIYSGTTATIDGRTYRLIKSPRV